MIKTIAHFVFRYAYFVMAILFAVSFFFAFEVSKLKIDAGFEKQLPYAHPYINTMTQYREEFGGEDRIFIAVSPKKGDIFSANFLTQFKAISDEAHYISGANRSWIESLFTPNVRFTEVVDGGFAGGNVIPADFDASPEAVEQVRQNVLKSSIIGRLVANDFSSAMISLQLAEHNPSTGEKLDPLLVAQELEKNIRERYQSDDIEIRIIGFAKVLGDIAEGAIGVVFFMLGAVLLVTCLLKGFVHSWSFTLSVIFCSLIAVVWNLGLLSFLGFGLDPMSMLIPFLIFAIGVSHGIQILNRVQHHVVEGGTVYEGALETFRVLFAPGLVALLSDTIGFFTIRLIKIQMIQDLAITASLGVLALILTNLLLLPLILSKLTLKKIHVEQLLKGRKQREKWWIALSQLSRRKAAFSMMIFVSILVIYCSSMAQNLDIGDSQEGVPELWGNARYNQDTAYITDKFSVGADVLNVIAESVDNACIRHDIVKLMDKFQWVLSNNPHVQGTLSLPQVMKIVSAAWNEGHPKWQELPRNSSSLGQAASAVETSTGLLNLACNAMPIMIFLKDHKAESINSVITEIKKFTEKHPHPDLTFSLATGNVGVMAATNDTISAAQYPILLWIYGAVGTLCLCLFRSLRATLCVLAPLALVSILTYALMNHLQIGLKTSTLPIAALGVGIGVDYGIYIFSQLKQYLDRGESLQKSFQETLAVNGTAVLVTGFVLSLAVSTWSFSTLKFQADMGLLFAFMLFANMCAALTLIPALSYFLYPKNRA